MDGFRLCRVEAASAGPAQPIRSVVASEAREGRMVASDATGAIWVGDTSSFEEKFELMFRGDSSSAGQAMGRAWVGIGVLVQQSGNLEEVVVGSDCELVAAELRAGVGYENGSEARRVAVVEHGLSCLSVSRSFVVAGDRAGGLRIVGSGVDGIRLEAHDSETTACCIVSSSSFNEDLVVVSGAQGSVKVWLGNYCVQELRVGLCLPTRLVPVSGVETSMLAVADRGGGLGIWTTEPKLVSLNDDTAEPIVAAALLAPNLLALADLTGATRLYNVDLNSGQADLSSTLKHDTPVIAIAGAYAFHADATTTHLIPQAPQQQERHEGIEESEIDESPAELNDANPEHVTTEEQPPSIDVVETDEGDEQDQEADPEPRLTVPLAAARPQPPETSLIRPSRVDATSPWATADLSDSDQRKAQFEADRAACAQAELEETQNRLDRARAIAAAATAAASAPVTEGSCQLQSLDQTKLPARKRVVPKQVDPNWLHRLDTLRPMREDFDIPDAVPSAHIRAHIKALKPLQPLTAYAELPMINDVHFVAPLRFELGHGHR